MENGQTFNYDETYKQYCGKEGAYPIRKEMLALPNQSGYFLFYLGVKLMENKCSVQNFRMAQIDMTKNNGLSKVLWKDSFLLKDICLQDASATRHANGRDWWILLGSNNSPQYYRFLYQPDIGVQGPWIQQIENPLLDDYYYNGWSAFSPDGTQYASLMNRIGLALYNFDRCTGLLSNMRLVTGSKNGPPNTPCVVFSPDSRYLYHSWQFGETIIQYDTKAADIGSSGIVVSPAIKWLFQDMLRGPDGKLYIACGNFGSDLIDSCISVLHFPNRKGATCKVEPYYYHLPESGGGFNMYYPNYRLGPLDHSSCDTLGLDNHPEALWRHDQEDTLQPRQVTFTDLSYYEPATWHWTFGDGTMSGDTSPVHTYAKAWGVQRLPRGEKCLRRRYPVQNRDRGQHLRHGGTGGPAGGGGLSQSV